MNYKLFFENPARHLIRIQAEITAAEPVELLLPRWRPGRYEMMEYASHITEVRAFSTGGNPLSIRRTGTHNWLLTPAAGETSVVEYKYYAHVIDAGRSFFDAEMVYLNPCNFLLYRKEELNASCTMEVNIPAQWMTACGLPRTGNVFHASDYHDLVDSPLLAAPTLRHYELDVRGTRFHLWFSGQFYIDEARVLRDSEKYIAAQIDMFGGFPVPEYHFLYHIVHGSFHHGVEHLRSTVIALGPASQFMSRDMYEDFLGISCHELFHTWNVKSIRPADMQPYDYNRENYSTLHWITEGVTTYYGDLLVMRAGIWDLPTFLRVFNSSVFGKYYSGDARKYITLEQSSFESWVSGYANGIPNRKVSFYTKGCLAAFILDHLLRRDTGNRVSLDDVMREMNERFGKTGKGYTRADYEQILRDLSGKDYTDYFDKYISGLEPVEPALAEAAAYFGLILEKVTVSSLMLRLLGLMLDDSQPGSPVKLVMEHSPAELAGISRDDVLLSVNGVAISGNHDEVLNLFRDHAHITVILMRRGFLHTVHVNPDPDFAVPVFRFSIDTTAGETQLLNRSLWTSVSAPKP